MQLISTQIKFFLSTFKIMSFAGEYFPMAYNDTIPVWEDESIAFDALANDYFAGHNASIVQYTKVR